MFALIDTPANVNNVGRNGTPLGQLFWDPATGYEYQFVQAKDAVTYAAGHVLTWKSRANHQVTNDISASEDSHACAGVALGVYTENYYVMILKRGYYAAVKKSSGDDSYAVTTLVTVHQSTDGMARKLTFGGTSGAPTAAELLVWARENRGMLGKPTAASDDTADTIPMRVNCL